MLYQGEHLWVGQLGHFCVLLSFIASLVATYAYFKATQATLADEHNSWKKLARISFVIETASVVFTFILLYIIIYNHYFEYLYAYKHSSKSLPTKYLLSCFWEGQEGSFMLWNFWHCVLGLVVMATAKKWETPVMTIISLAQVFLASFILGIYFFNIKVGSNPFVLVRNETPYVWAPIFKDPLYLQKYWRDGNGLNILLQNYWMVIHPPVIFLGFASTIVPFAFAIAGLWKKSYQEWIKPAIPWTIFSAALLGVGIMMGAAWAYESLTFGGYWAWDPVENASLVPWLIMVAGLHVILVNKSTGYSSKASFWFLFLAFITLVYSTFLTRTGVLGDTSVHSFAGEGDSLFWHLIAKMALFSALFIFIYFKNSKQIPVVKKEEEISSREFWMCVGALVFFISAAYITFYTSLPIINKIFGTHKAIGEDPEYIYNRVMILIAVIIGLLTATTQFLKYKGTPRNFWLKKISLPVIISALISLTISIFGKINYDKYGIGYLGAIHLALFASVYAVVANIAYIFLSLKGKLKAAGGSIAHIGFGLVLVAILITSSKKEIISVNRTGLAMPGLTDAKGRPDNGLENITLIMGVPTPMGKYIVTYQGDTALPNDEKVYFKVNYIRKDSATQKIKEQFTLYPDAFLMKGEGGRTSLSANPDSRHYWNKDIFTFVTSMPAPESVKDTTSFKKFAVSAGDTIFYSKGYILVNQIIEANKNTNKDLPLVDSAWLADISIVGNDGMNVKSNPALFAMGNNFIAKRDTVIAQNLILEVNKTAKGIELGVKESDAIMKYITLKAFQFPFIGLLWLGVIIMTAGFFISMFKRFSSN
jgi:cytochrome c-type biogenesis protein CcmF